MFLRVFRPSIRLYSISLRTRISGPWPLGLHNEVSGEQIQKKISPRAMTMSGLGKYEGDSVKLKHQFYLNFHMILSEVLSVALSS